MNFGNLEKIEEIILRPSKNFTIKNVVVLGKSNIRNGTRRDCTYTDAYKSNKYTDYNYVGSITIESSDFLVFTCVDENTKKPTEIYCTYQHIQKIRNAFEKILKNIENAFMFDGNSFILKPEYENYTQEISNLVNGHSIKIIYDVIYEESDVNGTETYRGCTIFFNDENYFVSIKEDILEGISYFLNNFNLLSSSQNLKLFAYLNQMSNSMNLENYEISPQDNKYNSVSSSGGSINNPIQRQFKIKKEQVDTDE